MKRILRVAVAQTEVLENNYERNMENAVLQIQKAAEQKADIICFPEFFTTGLPPVPETENGRTVQALAAAAKKHGIAVIAGTVVEKRNEGLFNVCHVIDPCGVPILKYEKSHLYFEEKQFGKAGNRVCPVFTIKQVKIGVAVCWELLIPEVIRLPALQGAEVVFCPTFVEAWKGPATAEERRRFCQVRAAENQIFVIDVCAAGSTTIYKAMGVMPLAGCSTVAGPGLLSDVIRGASAEPALLVADLDLDMIAAKRNLVPIFASRRPELYGDLFVV
ncbi:MAG: carbon-nitrogen hydrolase family protein [Desulfobacteraceae bacterium]|nr:MAG: carbon-nitrogen hydrolase family protein [Desulfobacteraceae bacterium]